MKFFVYVLLSQKHARTYVGQTDDIDIRLARHNAGYVRSTKAWRPWIMIHREAFESRSDAVQRETWFKSVAGRKLISLLVTNHHASGGLSDPASRDRDLVPAAPERTKPL